jgi:hypothetical protein
LGLGGGRLSLCCWLLLRDGEGRVQEEGLVLFEGGSIFEGDAMLAPLLLDISAELVGSIAECASQGEAK